MFVTVCHVDVVRSDCEPPLSQGRPQVIQPLRESAGIGFGARGRADRPIKNEVSILSIAETLLDEGACTSWVCG
jgi:hypothetical protein